MEGNTDNKNCRAKPFREYKSWRGDLERAWTSFRGRREKLARSRKVELSRVPARAHYCAATLAWALLLPYEVAWT